MRKFLKIKNYVFIIICLFLVYNTSASESNIKFYDSDLMFYKKILKNTGFEVPTSLRDINDNLLLLTSTNTLDDFNKIIDNKSSKNLFIVCNSDFSFKNLFKCDSNSFQYLENNFFELETIDLDKNGELKLYLLRNEKFNTFVFNQRLFESQENIKVIQNYLKAISKSNKVSIHNPKDSELSFKDMFSKITKSTTFEMSIYLILGLALTSFLIKILVYLNQIINKEKRLNLKEVFYTLDDLIFGIYANNIYARTFFIFSSLLFATLSFFVVLKDPEPVKNTVTGIFSNLIQFNVFEYLSKKEYIYFVFYAYVYIFGFILVSSRFQNLIDIFQNFFSKMSNKEVNPSFTKHFFVTMYLTTTIIFVFYTKFGSFEILYPFTLLSIFLIYFLYKQNIDLREVFSFKEKIVISFISLIIIPLVFVFLNYLYKPSFKYEEFIGVPDDIVLLPYKKQLGENRLIKELDTKSSAYINYPLYVDEYLIFYPGKNSIVNRNIKDFKSELHDFSVVGKDDKKIIQAVLTNSQILSNITENLQSNLFFVRNSEKSYKPLNLNLEVNCMNKKDITELKIEIFTLNDNGKIKNQTLSVGNILGCETKTKPYSFEFPDTNVQEFIFRFNNLPVDFIRNLSLSNSDDKDKILIKRFEIKKGFYSYLSVDSIKSKEIYNYFVEDKKSYTFSSGEIHEKINELVLGKSISDYFNVWSTESLRFIRNVN